GWAVVGLLGGEVGVGLVGWGCCRVCWVGSGLSWFGWSDVGLTGRGWLLGWVAADLLGQSWAT
ncbi:hypothetical protein, partial [Kibdelosporangium aridum]|uniref:hypothetical protein n=1 Tax=Kibdelosporangium aridum TaxID=2030 RepID=UPI001C8CEDF3